MTTQKKNHSTQIYMHTKKQLLFFTSFIVSNVATLFAMH